MLYLINIIQCKEYHLLFLPDIDRSHNKQQNNVHCDDYTIRMKGGRKEEDELNNVSITYLYISHTLRASIT